MAFFAHRNRVRFARMIAWWVTALALVVGTSTSGSFLPVLARLAAGPPAHACHCGVRGHGTCACPICNPELKEREADQGPALTGTCGEREARQTSLATPAILASTWIVAPPSRAAVVRREVILRVAADARPPPTPPPEDVAA